MSIGLLGQKIGMTSVYDAKGRLCPVTVIAAGDNVLLRRLTERKRRLFGRPGRVWRAEGIPCDQAVAWRIQKGWGGAAKDSCANFA